MGLLSEVFYWVLNMSIIAAITGLPVLLVRQIRRIPRRMTLLHYEFGYFPNRNINEWLLMFTPELLGEQPLYCTFVDAGV